MSKTKRARRRRLQMQVAAEQAAMLAAPTTDEVSAAPLPPPEPESAQEPPEEFFEEDLDEDDEDFGPDIEGIVAELNAGEVAVELECGEDASIATFDGQTITEAIEEAAMAYVARLRAFPQEEIVCTAYTSSGSVFGPVPARVTIGITVPMLEAANR